MASTYVNDLRLNEMATGDASGTWGEVTNTNLELIAEAFSFGTEAITTNADTHDTIIADGQSDPGRSMYLKYTGTLDSACTITIAPNTVSKMWFIENGTSGSQNIIISQGSGANITIPPGDVKVVYSDGAGSGAAMVDAFASLSVVDLKVQDDLTVTDDMTVGGTLGVTGIVTLTDDLIIGDGKTIGSASDVDAMTIAANGQVTFTQTLIGTALDISGDIDVDGTTNLDVVDIDGAVDMASTLAVTGAITGATAAFTQTNTVNSPVSARYNGSNKKVAFNINNSNGQGFIASNSNSVAGSANQTYDITNTAGKIDFGTGITIDTAVSGSAGGTITYVNNADFLPTGIVFNEGSADLDFRVESNGNANMLFVDGGDDGVVIGSGAKGPAVQTLNPSFQIIGSTQNFASMSLIGTTNDADGTNIIGAKGRSGNGGQGTIANSGDRVLNVRAVIDDGTNFDHEVGNMEFAVDGTPGANDTPGRIVFSTTADGANGATERMRISSAGTFGFGMQPLGSNNGSAFFDGNVSSKDGFMTTGTDLQLIAPSATNTIFVRDNGNESMRIDSSGNLLVGGTSSGGSGKVQADVGFDAQDGSFTTSIALRNYSSAANSGQITVDPDNVGASSVMYFGIDGISPAKMKLDSSGRLNIDQVDTRFGTGALNITGEVGASFNAIQFRHNAGTIVGTVVTSASATAYNTSSDYRLKENVDYTWDATTRLKQLKPARFNFISDDTNTLVDGFLAHEVSSIVPEAITGEKDAMINEEYEITPAVKGADGIVVTEAVMGTHSVPNYQNIDHSKLVPLLVKTIQELEARITTLEG